MKKRSKPDRKLSQTNLGERQNLKLLKNSLERLVCTNTDELRWCERVELTFWERKYLRVNEISAFSAILVDGILITAIEVEIRRCFGTLNRSNRQIFHNLLQTLRRKQKMAFQLCTKTFFHISPAILRFPLDSSINFHTFETYSW